MYVNKMPKKIERIFGLLCEDVVVRMSAAPIRGHHRVTSDPQIWLGTDFRPDTFPNATCLFLSTLGVHCLVNRPRIGFVPCLSVKAWDP